MTDNAQQDEAKRIKTIVFFDLEASGLKSYGNPRITELSLVATRLSTLLDLHKDIKAYFEKLRNSNGGYNEGYKPVESMMPRFEVNSFETKVLVQLRVLNKLTKCFYPQTLIYPEVAQLTGLDNYNLEGQPVFNRETLNLLDQFLSSLEQPVCLLAHNGDKFDYPLLVAEIERLGVSYPRPELLCADSYVGLKQLYAQLREREQLKQDLLAVQELLESGELDRSFSEDSVRAYREDLSPATSPRQELDEAEAGTPEKAEISTTCLLSPPPSVRKRRRTGSETSHTPKSKANSVLHLNGCLEDRSKNESTPERPVRLAEADGGLVGKRVAEVGQRSEESNGDARAAKKRLIFEPGAGPPQSFSLENLHKHFLGCAPSASHGAEADCLSLLRVTAAVGPDFIQWIQDNAKKISEYKKI